MWRFGEFHHYNTLDLVRCCRFFLSRDFNIFFLTLRFVNLLLLKVLWDEIFCICFTSEGIGTKLNTLPSYNHTIFSMDQLIDKKTVGCSVIYEANLQFRCVFNVNRVFKKLFTRNTWSYNMLVSGLKYYRNFTKWSSEQCCNITVYAATYIPELVMTGIIFSFRVRV